MISRASIKKRAFALGNLRSKQAAAKPTLRSRPDRAEGLKALSRRFRSEERCRISGDSSQLVFPSWLHDRKDFWNTNRSQNEHKMTCPFRHVRSDRGRQTSCTPGLRRGCINMHSRIARVSLCCGVTTKTIQWSKTVLVVRYRHCTRRWERSVDYGRFRRYQSNVGNRVIPKIHAASFL